MKTAVITGASSGLGREISKINSLYYDNLVLIGRNSAKLNETAQMCFENGAKYVFCLSCDLTKNDQIKSTVDWITSHFKTIDLLVNNAGLGYFENFLEQDFEKIENTINTDLLGSMKLTRSLLPAMIDHVQAKAHIVNVASIAGKIATPKTTSYAAAKFGMVGFSNALRLEMKARNVGVHTINPGPMKTAFFDKADPSGKYIQGVQNFVVSAEQVAALSVAAVKYDIREINTPFIMEVGSQLYNMFPTLGDYIVNSPLINRK